MKENTKQSVIKKLDDNGTVVVIDSEGNEWVDLTIGMDLGDKTSLYCVLENGSGDKILEGKVKTTREAFKKEFGAFPPSRVALEVGSHSRWTSQVVAQFGHEVLVANARELKAITSSTRKNDRADAEMLARLARVDVKLLRPIRHRGEDVQADLTIIRARDALVEVRTKLVNAVRGLVKASGSRIKACPTEQFSQQANEQIPESLRPALAPLLEQIDHANEQIDYYDRLVEHLAEKKYPETKRLSQVRGVGALTALAFVLTLEEPGRFERSRDVGCYLGLRPKQRQSGDSNPQLRISKTGDVYLRQLLVSCGHYILGPFGKDCHLRQWGTRLAGRGGKNAKKRAVVAVARKLAVLLHRLWVSGDVYDPMRGYEAVKTAVEAK
jgi:transposase